MSGPAGVALLAGLFGVPVVLLALGHRLRERRPALRRAFWGGVIGHSVTLLVAVTAAHYPPVLWQSDDRMVLVFWLVPVGSVVAAAIAAATARSVRR